VQWESVHCVSRGVAHELRHLRAQILERNHACSTHKSHATTRRVYGCSGEHVHCVSPAIMPDSTETTPTYDASGAAMSRVSTCKAPCSYRH
jgi:hypothetical protein